MIRFACSNCSRVISVDEKYSGRKGKCPKCGGVVVVPESSTIIAFACRSCGHKIRIPEKHAGKKGKCPKCQSPVVIPPIEKPPSETAETFNFACPMCEQIVQVAETSRGQTIECPACGSYVETSPDDVGDESDAAVPRGADEEESEEEYEETEGVDRRLIMTICAVAGAVIVGLILLAVVVRLARPSRQKETYSSAGLAQAEIDRAQEFAERYIGLLESGETEQAHQLHSSGFTGPGYKSQIDLFSKQINISTVTNVDCTRTHCESQSGEDHILLWYSLQYEEGSQPLILSVIRIDRELMIDGIATWHHPSRPFVAGLSGSRHPFSAGPKTQAALRVAAKTEYERSERVVGKYMYVLLIVGLVFLVIQMVSMWIVFEKDGRPGWASIVPFYNMWILAEIGGKHGAVGLVMCGTGLIPIPYVGGLIAFALWIVISLGVAKTFGRGIFFGIGLGFVPEIFYPILAFRRG